MSWNMFKRFCYLLPLLVGGSDELELSLLNLIPTGDAGLCLARVTGGDTGLLGARWRGGGEGICPGDNLCPGESRVNAESGDPGISSPLLSRGSEGMSVGDGEDGMSGRLCCKTGRSAGERGCFLRRSLC